MLKIRDFEYLSLDLWYQRKREHIMCNVSGFFFFCLFYGSLIPESISQKTNNDGLQPFTKNVLEMLIFHYKDKTICCDEVDYGLFEI